MKKLIFVILLLLGFVLAEAPKSGWAYVISAIGVKNSPNNVVYTSGDTSAGSNATYVLSPQVIVWDDTLDYVGSLAPFTGCLNSQHYSNGEPSGFCFTGGLATTEQDGLMSKEDKTLLQDYINKTSYKNQLNTSFYHINEKNSVNWTKNNDGTFTMAGTVTSDNLNNRTVLNLYEGDNVFSGMKFVGNPYAGNENCLLYVDYIDENYNWFNTDIDHDDNGIIIKDSPYIKIHIIVKQGFTETDTIIFKPMVTKNLEAKYNDYIPFSEGLLSGKNIEKSKIYESVNFLNLADGEKITLSVTFPKSGFYIVTLVVSMCGANGITKSNPYWRVDGSGVTLREPTSHFGVDIPISPQWDDSHLVTFASYYAKGTYDFVFTNLTGISTNNIYGSTCAVQAIEL